MVFTSLGATFHQVEEDEAKGGMRKEVCRFTPTRRPNRCQREVAPRRDFPLVPFHPKLLTGPADRGYQEGPQEKENPRQHEKYQIPKTLSPGVQKVQGAAKGPRQHLGHHDCGLP